MEEIAPGLERDLQSLRPAGVGSGGAGEHDPGGATDTRVPARTDVRRRRPGADRRCQRNRVKSATATTTTPMIVKKLRALACRTAPASTARCASA